MIKNNYNLDLRDIKILHQLDINARQSNSAIGKKTRLSKEVVKYRIDRMVEEGIIIRFHTVISYFKLGIVKYKLYLRLKNINKEILEEIGSYFKNNKKTEWVVVCTGRWDMIVGFLVHNVNEFDDELQEILSKFSKHIDDKAVTTTLYLAHHIREYLQKKGLSEKDVVYHTTADKQEKTENIDTEILKMIANNARMPINEIAKRLKTTSKIVRYHTKELEKKQIILAYKVHLEPKKMGNISCKAIIYLMNTTKERLKQFVNYSSSLSNAVWPQRVMGAWDFELDFELKSYDVFQDIILDIKEKFSDIIKDYEFVIVSKEFKLDLFPGCYPTFRKQ